MEQIQIIALYGTDIRFGFKLKLEKGLYKFINYKLISGWGRSIMNGSNDFDFHFVFIDCLYFQ